MTNEDKMALISLIGIIEKLDDGAKKYIMGVADGMSFCNMQQDQKAKEIDKASQEVFAYLKKKRGEILNDLKIIEQREVLGKEFNIYGDFENPLFLAKDVANWIEHSDISTMMRTVDDNEKGAVGKY